MGSKYLPTVKDQKANLRYHQQQQRALRQQKASAKAPVAKAVKK
jgi:hypothetical protein